MDFTVLEARYYVSPVGSDVTRRVRDFEIDLEIGSGRDYINNGNEYKVCRGDILIRRPTDICRSIGVQKTFLLTVDFSNRPFISNYNRNLSGETHPPYSDDLIDRLPSVIHVENTEEYLSVYKNLINLTDNNSPAAKELVKELIYMLNAEICKNNYLRMKPKESMSEKVLAYMRKNLQKNIALEDLSDLVHLEKSYFTRQFKKSTGKTPINALIEMRMEKACDLIANTDIKITQIAQMCGYNNTSFFISQYKRKFGVTPENHRKESR